MAKSTKKDIETKVNDNKKDEAKVEQNFDRTNEYTSEIMPKLQEVAELCEKYGIPHLFSVEYKNDSKTIGRGLVFSSQGKENTIEVKKMQIAANFINDADSVLKSAVVAMILGGIKEDIEPKLGKAGMMLANEIMGEFVKCDDIEELKSMLSEYL